MEWARLLYTGTYRIPVAAGISDLICNTVTVYFDIYCGTGKPICISLGLEVAVQVLKL